jgi:UDP-galactopyranose mutase
MTNQFDILVVGCGLSGIVIAERFANEMGKRVLIIDKRDHIGGNVYDYIDQDTGILMNKYGAHLFHTNSDRVWSYVTRFGKWTRWDHEVVGQVDGRLVNIPVNINTVNALCGENLKTTEEMDVWLAANQVKYGEDSCVVDNSEKMAKSRVGEVLYEKIFKEYTYKQWAKYPEELDASVLARIPIRNDFDNRYFNDKYQALPEKGYTDFVNRVIDHPNITVLLNTSYDDFINERSATGVVFEHIIYTGPIDAFYADKGLEKLEYRSIDFIVEKYKNVNYYQSKSVVNYPEKTPEYTRIVEYKHFLNQVSPDTVVVKEVTKDGGEPYYPIPNKKNMELYEKYKQFTLEEKRVHFLGRLANYKYFNMDAAILNALEYFDKNFLDV